MGFDLEHRGLGSFGLQNDLGHRHFSFMTPPLLGIRDRTGPKLVCKTHHMAVQHLLPKNHLHKTGADQASNINVRSHKFHKRGDIPVLG